MDVDLTEWQPSWTNDLDALAARIRGASGPAAVRIDHIGSTSVPGMPAKDVIDVQIIVRHLPNKPLVDGLLGRCSSSASRPWRKTSAPTARSRTRPPTY